MVSSFAIHYGNQKTHAPSCCASTRDERAGGPVPIQLFGQDPDVMRSRRGDASPSAGADLIDLNMGCPVPKVCKTGAGAALINDPDTAVAVARAAREGSGLPVTVKLRSGPQARRDRRLRRSRTGSSTRPASPRSASTRAPPRSTTRARPTTTSPPSSSRRSPVPGDPHRRPGRAPSHIRARVRAHGRGRGDARARIARQPVAVRAAARPPRRRARRARRSSTSSTG